MASVVFELRGKISDPTKLPPGAGIQRVVCMPSCVGEA